MVNDVIGDFLAQVKNAIKRNKNKVEIRSSKLLVEIARILKEEGFIVDYSVEELDAHNQLTIELKYVNGDSAITDLKRISKPGVRKYRGYREINPVRNGLGVSIYSTPKGVMSGASAVREKVGGEILCEIF